MTARLALSILSFSHALEMEREKRRDSDGTRSAETACPAPVPKDCQARAETWLRVPSFPGYIVSSAGRVRHSRVNAPILKGSLDKDGYRRVCVHGCTIRLHAIVCETFHGPRPEGRECAHLDGDKMNNRASNLAWVTASENTLHKNEHGTANGGRRNPNLTAETIDAIRASPLSSRKAAAAFGLSQSYVVRIRNGARSESIAQPISRSPQ